MLSHASSSKDLNAFLRAMAEESQPLAEIYPHVIAFANAQEKQRALDSIAQSFGDPVAEEKQLRYEDYETCMPITASRSTLRASGTVLWFSCPISNITAEDNKWHAMLVLYKAGMVAVMDPNFVRGRQGYRVHDMQGRGLLEKFRVWMRSNRRGMNRLKVGGGSRENDGGHCVSIGARFLEDWVNAGCDWGVFSEWDDLRW